MNTVDDSGIINFRVSRQERLQLRLLLLQQGTTFQAFFANVTKETLARQAKGQRKAAAKERISS